MEAIDQAVEIVDALVTACVLHDDELFVAILEDLHVNHPDDAIIAGVIQTFANYECVRIEIEARAAGMTPVEYHRAVLRERARHA